MEEEEEEEYGGSNNNNNNDEDHQQKRKEFLQRRREKLQMSSCRSCFLKLSYDMEIREKQMYETILYSCYQLLPDAIEKTEEEGRFFLRENIQTPPMTSWRRRKE
jgi:hypothetical protein